MPAQGPIPPGGFRKGAAGSALWHWSCSRCSAAAGNTSRLLELLRTGCGEHEGAWEQRRHITVVQGQRVVCTRCGTSRQRYVHLAGQICPSRCLVRQGLEVPEGSSVYAAWLQASRRMHRHGSLGQQVAGQPGVQPVVAAAEAAVLVPAPAMQLRPYLAHRLINVGACELCIRCFAKAPRYRVGEWRTGCCDGDSPVGACPKHVLAAVHVQGAGGQGGQAGSRLLELQTAAKDWHRSLSAKTLRPPKRRAGPRQPPPLDPAARIRSRS